jgi:hypothetical protein
MKSLSLFHILVAAAVVCLGWFVSFVWLIDDRIIAFVAGFSLALFLAALIVYLLGWAVVARILLALTHDDSRQRLRRHPNEYRLVVHGLLILLIALALPMNFALPGRLSPWSLAADAFLLFALGTLSLAVLDRRWGRLGLSAAGGVVIVVILLIAPRPASTGAEKSTLNTLSTLPYLAWTEAGDDIDLVGVVHYDTTRTYDGLNLYTPQPTSMARLVDMEGNAINEWNVDLEGGDVWNHAELLPNGDLFAMVSVRGTLMRLDWDSNVLWVDQQRHYHHDLDVAANGDIYALTRKTDIVRVAGFPIPIEDDCITVLDPVTRRIKMEISLFRVLRDRFSSRSLIVPRYRWLMYPVYLRRLIAKRTALSSSPVDVFHANAVDVIERDLGGPFVPGNIMFCSRTLSLVGVIDPDSEALVWSWGEGELDWPHHPTLLDNGNVLIFDNGYHRKFSRIVEIEPASGEIVWEYRSDPPENFFSQFRGSSQRLENGNTLIGDGENGHAFEVTPEGEVVWEFFNPVTSEETNERSTLYRMIRHTDRLRRVDQ